MQYNSSTAQQSLLPMSSQEGEWKGPVLRNGKVVKKVPVPEVQKVPEVIPAQQSTRAQSPASVPAEGSTHPGDPPEVTSQSRSPPRSRSQSPAGPPPSRRSSAASETAVPSRYPAYWIVSSGPTAETTGLLHLEKNLKGLKISVRRTAATGAKLIRAKDDASAAILEGMTAPDSSPVRLQRAAPPTRTAVLQRVPLHLKEEDLVQCIPQVIRATRLTKWDRTMKAEYRTSSVKVTWNASSLPEVVKTTFLGSFPVRPYTPDPTRCYRCQKYGHVARECRGSERCGICAAHHKTAVCLSAKKSGQEVRSRCANCQGDHVAASKACPVRRERARRLQPAKKVETPKKAQAPKKAAATKRAAEPKKPAAPKVNPATSAQVSLSEDNFPELPSPATKKADSYQEVPSYAEVLASPTPAPTQSSEEVAASTPVRSLQQQQR